MHIVVDEDISFAKEMFEQFGKVTLLHGREIDRKALANADALVVRSITKVNRALLEQTPVKFVGTATIGTDHIDKSYLHEAGITFADAKGCNADAVTEYILTAVFHSLMQLQFQPKGLKFGIIGCGNIGGRLARILPQMGFEVVKNDPPLQRLGQSGLSSLEEVLQCDIITCHTPLNRGGIDNTYHLIGTKELAAAANLKLLLNASRGEVVAGDALLRAHVERQFITVLDVWENEPEIDPDVLDIVNLASPHIAGYTYEGKVNGTTMMYDALREAFSMHQLPVGSTLITPLIEPVAEPEITVDGSMNITGMLHTIFSIIYDIRKDTEMIKASQTMSGAERGKYFDLLRKEYQLRREFNNYTLHIANAENEKIDLLHLLRFNTRVV